MTYDDLVIGTGMAGLTVGALLARSGRRVLMLEAHEYPGGYAHTFPMGDYRFCAQVHYIFSCGEGESVHTLLDALGLADEVRFVRLDPEGFDHVVIDGDRYRIPNGFPKFRDRLIRRHPDAETPLRRYFQTIMALREEMSRLPDDVRWRDLLTAPLRFPHLLRDRSSTLQDLYDRLRMPQQLQAVLAGQAGDYLLPPERASLVLHTALVSAYDRGAFYPERHFGHLIDSLVEAIRRQAGCEVRLSHEVDALAVDGDRVVGVRTTNGESFRAERVISNVDPRRTAAMIRPPMTSDDFARSLDYAYSDSSFTMYLGLRGLDLRDHGFGSFNVWHYPHNDINRIYRKQIDEHDLTDPWLFLATPSLHSGAPGLAPDGHQVLEVATSASYAPFEALRAESESAYYKSKTRIRDTILDILEDRYIPGLRNHIAMRVVGTPLTNEHFVWSPRGNAYGAALSPDNVVWPRVDFSTPLENLFLVNATAGYPSIGGTVASGLALYERLTGDCL